MLEQKHEHAAERSEKKMPASEQFLGAEGEYEKYVIDAYESSKKATASELQQLADVLVIVTPKQLKKTFKPIDGLPRDKLAKAAKYDLTRTYKKLVTLLLSLASKGVTLNDASLALLKSEAQLDKVVDGVNEYIVKTTGDVIEARKKGDITALQMWDAYIETGLFVALVSRQASILAPFISKEKLALKYMQEKSDRNMEAFELNHLSALTRMLELAAPKSEEGSVAIVCQYYEMILSRVLILNTAGFEPRIDYREMLERKPPAGLTVSAASLDTISQYFETLKTQFEQNLPEHNQSLMPHQWLSEQEQAGYAKGFFANMIKLDKYICHIALAPAKLTTLKELLSQIVKLYAEIAIYGYLPPAEYSLKDFISIRKFQPMIKEMIASAASVIEEIAIMAVLGVDRKLLRDMAAIKMLPAPDTYRESLVNRLLDCEDGPDKARAIYWLIGFDSMQGPMPTKIISGKEMIDLDVNCSLLSFFYYSAYSKKHSHGFLQWPADYLNSLSLSLRTMGVNKLNDCKPEEAIRLTFTPGVTPAPLISDKATPQVSQLIRFLLTDVGAEKIPEYFPELKGDLMIVQLRAKLMRHILPWVLSPSALHVTLSAHAKNMTPEEDTRFGLINKYIQNQKYLKALRIMVLAPVAFGLISKNKYPLFCTEILKVLRVDEGLTTYTVEEKRQTIAPKLLSWIVEGDVFKTEVLEAQKLLNDVKLKESDKGPRN